MRGRGLPVGLAAGTGAAVVGYLVGAVLLGLAVGGRSTGGVIVASWGVAVGVPLLCGVAVGLVLGRRVRADRRAVAGWVGVTASVVPPGVWVGRTLAVVVAQDGPWVGYLVGTCSGLVVGGVLALLLVRSANRELDLQSRRQGPRPAGWGR